MLRVWIAFYLVSSAAAQTLSVAHAAMPASKDLLSVAPGSLVLLTSSPGIRAGDLSQYQVLMDVPAASQPLPLTLIRWDADGIWALVPAGAPLGEFALRLTGNGLTFSGSISITQSSFGIFSASPYGNGPAIAQQIEAGGALTLNRFTAPAVPGQWVTLWGTGVGTFTTPDVSVEIYGTAVPAAFAGHAPGQPGLDQINFRIPANAPFGCYVPVQVSVGGNDVSNRAAIAIADSSRTPCSVGADLGSVDHPRSGRQGDRRSTLDLERRIPLG